MHLTTYDYTGYNPAKSLSIYNLFIKVIDTVFQNEPVFYSIYATILNDK
jgi:hypothetical protein